MKDQTVKIRLVLLCLLAVFATGVWWLVLNTAGAGLVHLSVTFFDVGQGDAILIETPEGVQVLIDGGRDNKIVRLLPAQLGWFDRDLDLLIGTHPDLDHIGGLVDVLDRYQVDAVLTTENTGESVAAAAYQARMKAEGAEVVYARAGQVFQLGASTTLEVLSPARDPAFLESNASSIVVQLRYGDTTFMLTGDAPAGIEDYLVTQYKDALQSDVLKLGHHGSDTSTSALWLQNVKPQLAIVSAGKDNRYGHPHQNVIDRVRAVGSTILSTAEIGSITLYSDGVQIWREN